MQTFGEKSALESEKSDAKAKSDLKKQRLDAYESGSMSGKLEYFVGESLEAISDVSNCVVMWSVDDVDMNAASRDGCNNCSCGCDWDILVLLRWWG